MPQKLGTRCRTKMSRRGFLSSRCVEYPVARLRLRLKLGPSRAAELYRSKPLVLQSTSTRRLPVAEGVPSFYSDIDVKVCD
jgi:hypothetical protein